jgi:hypothetical protein
MRSRELLNLSLLVAAFCVSVGACSGVGNDGDGGSTSADPYPTQTISATSRTEEKSFSNTDDYYAYVSEAFGSDQSKWPEAVFTAVLHATSSLTVTLHEYQVVDGVVFFEYCNWYQPNSTLSITLSSINETSVSESITTSVGISMAYSGVEISASISKQTTQTVTTSQGIEVATSYDLTQYDQSKLYKAVLTGTYTCIDYTFGADGTSYGTGKGIKVDQSSLAVRLVHD